MDGSSAGASEAVAQRLADGIVRHVREVITVVAADGTVLFVNDATTATLGHVPEQSRGTAAASYVHPDDQAYALERRSWLLAEAGRTTTTLMRVRTGSGDWRYVETHGTNLLHDPEVRGILYVTRDVEDRARAELSLVHALGAARVVADLGLRALQVGVDELAQEALGRAAALLGAERLVLLLPDRGAPAAGAVVVGADVGRGALPVGAVWPEPVEPGTGPRLVDDGADVPLRGPAGPLGVLLVRGRAGRTLGPAEVQFVEGVADVLSGALLRAERERTAVVAALHDPLTGLPTRALFEDRLAHALERCRRGGTGIAVLLVDLDRFKHVNDAWGHLAGDAVLRELGGRIAAAVRATDTAARLGGDEFVVLCEEDVTHVGVARVAAAVRRACASEVRLPNGEPVLLSASVGTAWSVEEGTDAQALLAAADASMYLDKRFGLRV